MSLIVLRNEGEVLGGGGRVVVRGHQGGWGNMDAGVVVAWGNRSVNKK